MILWNRGWTIYMGCEWSFESGWTMFLSGNHTIVLCGQGCVTDKTLFKPHSVSETNKLWKISMNGQSGQIELGFLGGCLETVDWYRAVDWYQDLRDLQLPSFASLLAWLSIDLASWSIGSGFCKSSSWKISRNPRDCAQSLVHRHLVSGENKGGWKIECHSQFSLEELPSLISAFWNIFQWAHTVQLTICCMVTWTLGQQEKQGEMEDRVKGLQTPRLSWKSCQVYQVASVHTKWTIVSKEEEINCCLTWHIHMLCVCHVNVVDSSTDV